MPAEAPDRLFRLGERQIKIAAKIESVDQRPGRIE